MRHSQKLTCSQVVSMGTCALRRSLVERVSESTVGALLSSSYGSLRRKGCRWSYSLPAMNISESTGQLPVFNCIVREKWCRLPNGSQRSTSGSLISKKVQSVRNLARSTHTTFYPRQNRAPSSNSQNDGSDGVRGLWPTCYYFSSHRCLSSHGCGYRIQPR